MAELQGLIQRLKATLARQQKAVEETTKYIASLERAQADRGTK